MPRPATAPLSHAAILLLAWGAAPAGAADEPPSAVRVATYNVSFYRDAPGQLLADLRRGDDPRASRVAEVLQRARPDVVLLNEVDYDGGLAVADALRSLYLERAQAGQPPIAYPHAFVAPVNTGVRAPFDLDRDGADDGPNDCWGYGRYPGQYGMLVLSRWPIDAPASRTFQHVKWSAQPDARRPVDPATGEPYYTGAEWSELRLPSKSFWDVVVRVPAPGGAFYPLHLLCSHPTPPVFDGPEDRNGRRNHDEVRMVADYLTPGADGYLVDDAGRAGGLAAGEHFVVLGDLNADPVDGGGPRGAIRRLLSHPRLCGDQPPTSQGGAEASQLGDPKNREHRAPPERDTADFSGDGQGNLRVDYALASRTLAWRGAGVFWPKRGEPGAEAIGATDHRLVWVDVAFGVPQPAE